MGVDLNLGSGGTLHPTITGARGASGFGLTSVVKSGLGIGPAASATSTAAPIVGQAAATPFVIPAAGMTIHGLVFEVTTLQASGLARVVLWNDDGTIYPGTVLYDTPDAQRVDTGTTGVKTITPASDIVLASAANDFVIWGAVVTQGTPASAPTYRSVTGLCPLIPLSATVAVAANTGYSKTGVTGAAPTWVGTAVALTSTTPFLRLISV